MLAQSHPGSDQRQGLDLEADQGPLLAAELDADQMDRLTQADARKARSATLPTDAREAHQDASRASYSSGAIPARMAKRTRSGTLSMRSFIMIRAR